MWLLGLLVFALLCAASQCADQSSPPTRYLMYSLNRGEGFNAVRDMVLRVSRLTQLLSAHGPWKLVLSPFYNPHWYDRQELPWSDFFDLDILRTQVDVVELHEFVASRGGSLTIDHIVHLSTNISREFNAPPVPVECDFGSYPGNALERRADGHWHGHFFGYGDRIRGARLACLSLLADVSAMVPYLLSQPHEVVMLARAEALMHHEFGGPAFWALRESQVYTAALRQIARDFRQSHLPDRYLAVHLRRGDFLLSRPDAIVPMDSTVAQLARLASSHNITHVFVSSDAGQHDQAFADIYRAPFAVVRFPLALADVSHDTTAARENTLGALHSGEIAAVDQLICAAATLFVGSDDSTFTSKIREEREFLGLARNTTDLTLCLSASATRPCRAELHWMPPAPARTHPVRL